MAQFVESKGNNLRRFAILLFLVGIAYILVSIWLRGFSEEILGSVGLAWILVGVSFHISASTEDRIIHNQRIILDRLSRNEETKMSESLPK